MKKINMVLKMNMFSSHGVLTYPDMLFMRWREMNGKKKHINVNEHIVIHKKNK